MLNENLLRNVLPAHAYVMKSSWSFDILETGLFTKGGGSVYV